MIIDMHTHLGFRDGAAKPFWHGWVEIAALIIDLLLDVVQPQVPDLWDISGDMIVKDMDAAGIMGGNAARLLGLAE